MRKKITLSLLLGLGILFQTSAGFAATGQTPNFEDAWQEAATSQAYSFTCKVSSTSVRMEKVELPADQQKVVDLTFKALKRYKNTTKGVFLGADRRLSALQTKFGTLGIVDLMAAGQLTVDEAVQAMEALLKKTSKLVVDDTKVYYNVGKGWKVFVDADLAGKLYDGAAGEPFTAELEKNSFLLKSGIEQSNGAVYQGTLTSDSTVSLLTPFMGEELAKKEALSPVKLFISGDGHIKKREAVAKVVIGNSSSFKVKEKCNINFTNPKIAIPSGAQAVDKDLGLQEIVEGFSR